MTRRVLEGSILFRSCAAWTALLGPVQAALANCFLGSFAGACAHPAIAAAVRGCGFVRLIRHCGLRLLALLEAEASKSRIVGQCKAAAVSPLKAAGSILAVGITVNTALWSLLEQQSAAGWFIRAGWFLFALAALSSRASWKDIKSSSLLLRRVP